METNVVAVVEFIVRQVKFNRFLHPNEQPRRFKGHKKPDKSNKYSRVDFGLFVTPSPLFKFGSNPSLIDGILNTFPYELAS